MKERGVAARRVTTKMASDSKLPWSFKVDEAVWRMEKNVYCTVCKFRSRKPCAKLGKKARNGRDEVCSPGRRTTQSFTHDLDCW